MNGNQLPINSELDLRPKISVIGVGGAGGNAVNNMIRLKLEGVKFLVANTDAQALEQSLVDKSNRIQLGLNVTQGLGAGAKPDVGRASAEEALEELIHHLQGSNMVFITAGMGGGTGTGAAPTIAKAAREIGILTVGVVTKPFHFEGRNRSKLAEAGIDELQQYVDTLIVIPNQNLFRIATENTTFADAFRMADDVLYSGVRGVTDLMIMPGLVNLDFADIRTVMAEMGKAMMGTGEAEGPRRALDAAEAAISNPLLDDVSMKGAKALLISVTGGYDMTLYEVDEAANRIRDEVDSEANIIFGSTFDERLNGMIRVSVVATGIGPANTITAAAPAKPKATVAEESIEVASFAGMRSPFAKPFVTQDATNAVSSDKFLVLEESSAALATETVESDELAKKDFHSDVTLALSNIQPAEVELPQQPEAQERRRHISLFERFSGRTRAPVAAPEAPTPQSAAEEISEVDFLEIPAFLRKGTSTNPNT
ncbi:MAG: cell division protein FtsZ [Alphaproteobacteria bacterium]